MYLIEKNSISVLVPHCGTVALTISSFNGRSTHFSCGSIASSVRDISNGSSFVTVTSPGSPRLKTSVCQVRPTRYFVAVVSIFVQTETVCASLYLTVVVRLILERAAGQPTSLSARRGAAPEVHSGVRFAPPRVASQASVTSFNDERSPFGCGGTSAPAL